MAFGFSSNNPRHRRAYADAMLRKADATGTLQDFEAAKTAIEQAGESARSKRANFQARLASVALRDADTRSIVTVAQETFDPKATPPSIIEGINRSHVLQQRGSPDLREMSHGVTSFRGYWESVADGHIEGGSRLVIADQTTGKSFRLPLIDHETIDTTVVRRLPDDVRSEIAALACRITEPILPHDSIGQ